MFVETTLSPVAVNILIHRRRPEAKPPFADLVPVCWIYPVAPLRKAANDKAPDCQTNQEPANPVTPERFHQLPPSLSRDLTSPPPLAGPTWFVRETGPGPKAVARQIRPLRPGRL